MNIKRIKDGLHFIISPFHTIAQSGRASFSSLFSSSVLTSASHLIAPLSLAEFKQIFDAELETFFAEKRVRIEAIAAESRTASILSMYDQAVAITLAGGKRIRPYMAFLAYVSTAQRSGLSREQVVRSVICLELFHAFALIHDDIIDMSDERHGLKTVHAFFTQLSHTPFPNDIASCATDVRIGAPIAQVGKSHAIMIGDLFFSMAQEAITAFVPLHQQAQVREYFDVMATEVVIGEMLDVHQTVLGTVTDEAIRQKNDLKTARYTFVNPIKIGFALAGEAVSLRAHAGTHAGTYAHAHSQDRALTKEYVSTKDRAHTHMQDEVFINRELLAFADEFGAELGFGFQVQDDMLDLIGTEVHTGKPVFLDIAEGQHTIFTQYILTFNDRFSTPEYTDMYGDHQDMLPATDVARFKSLLGKKEMHGSFLTAQEGQFVRELMQRAGAIAYGTRLINSSIARARTSLEHVQLEHKNYWEEIITRIEKRNN
jgi:geranylgeranyl pyrophosphate synthase